MTNLSTLDIYTKGTRAWFPDDREGWIIGILSSIDKSQTNVKMSFTIGDTVVVNALMLDCRI
jgi:myosin-5